MITQSHEFVLKIFPGAEDVISENLAANVRFEAVPEPHTHWCIIMFDALTRCPQSGTFGVSED